MFGEASWFMGDCLSQYPSNGGRGKDSPWNFFKQDTNLIYEAFTLMI